jgi:phosphoribosylanthranilate isomerase
MWIKICANTNFEDAALAVELGADALGFVFAPSSRRVTSAQAAAITSRLPATVEKIGVFDSSDAEEIAATVRAAHLTGAQLHRDFSPALVEVLARLIPGLRIIQTTHWNVGGAGCGSAPATFEVLRAAEKVDAVLIDSRTATASGGTGVAFDWDAAQRSLSAVAPKRLIVAGGLNAQNVGEAIRVLQPWGVDVASGVEARPGHKDREKLAEFIARARTS